MQKQTLQNQTKKDKAVIVIGKAIFQQTIDEKLFQQQEIMDTLNKDKWLINIYRYPKKNWKQIFFKMVQCLALKIYLVTNRCPKIIKQIQHVSYTKLKQLWLVENNIQNIQALSFMNFYNLQCLNLNYNYISRIKSLNKLCTSFLDQIHLALNPLTDISSFTKVNTNPKIFQFVYLEQYQQKSVINEDFSLIVKLRSDSLFYFYIQSKRRIKQPKIYTQMKLRFQFIRIHSWIKY